MKRVIIVLLSVVMLFACVGCGGTAPAGNIIVNGGGHNTGTAPSVEAPVKKLFIELNGGSMEITDGMSFEDIMQMKPVKEGYEFAGWYGDEAFTNYIRPNAIAIAQKERATAYAKWIQVGYATYEVRSEHATITDSGRKNQIMDTVYLTRDYDLVDLQRAGYTTLKVFVYLDVAEENKGYQYVFLYSSTDCRAGSTSLEDLFDKYVNGKDPEDPGLLFTYRYEHGGTEKCTTWGKMSFMAEIPIADLTDNLYIRYGASGEKEDTWYNRNVYVVIEPQK